MMAEAERDKLMGVAVRTAAARPAFLGWVLAEYQKAEGLDDAALAQSLRTESKMISSLRLCLRPRSDRFLQDIEQIAATFACDGDALVAVVRHVEFLNAARGTSSATDAGRLMAARSRPPKRRGRKGGGKS
jgi:hypothetical protein